MDKSFGVYRTHQLRELGLGRYEIQRLHAVGDLVRLRRGWWATRQADQRVVRAVRAKAALTCASALHVHGVWVLDLSRLHVRHSKHFQQRGAAPNPAPGEVKLCHVPGRPHASEDGIDDLAVALSAAAQCLAAAELVIVLDSIMNLRLLTRTEMAGALAEAPARTRALIDRCDRAESGTETLVRLRLRASGVRVRTQVPVDGIGRVDLLVGDRLIIEVDSREHHTSSEAYESDRTRDRRLTARGYLVIRLSYRQVLREWDEVEPDLLALIRRDAHARIPATARYKVAARPI